MRKKVYEEVFNNELTHAWYIGTRKKMMDTMKGFINRNSRILDAGCGTGGTMKFLKSYGFNNVTGIDASEDALKYCKERGLKNIKKGSINKLPFKNETFDAIICLDVLYHKNVIPNTALKEFSRVLKSKGILYLQEPAYEWLRGSHDEAILTGRRFSIESIKYILEKTGFNIKKWTYFNSLFLLPIIANRLINRKNKRSDVQHIPFVFNKIFLAILLIEAKLTNYISFPFGLSIIMIAQRK